MTLTPALWLAYGLTACTWGRLFFAPEEELEVADCHQPLDLALEVPLRQIETLEGADLEFRLGDLGGIHYSEGLDALARMLSDNTLTLGDQDRFPALPISQLPRVLSGRPSLFLMDLDGWCEKEDELADDYGFPSEWFRRLRTDSQAYLIAPSDGGAVLIAGRSAVGVQHGIIHFLKSAEVVPDANDPDRFHSTWAPRRVLNYPDVEQRIAQISFYGLLMYDSYCDHDDTGVAPDEWFDTCIASCDLAEATCRTLQTLVDEPVWNQFNYVLEKDYAGNIAADGDLKHPSTYARFEQIVAYMEERQVEVIPAVHGGFEVSRGDSLFGDAPGGAQGNVALSEGLLVQDLEVELEPKEVDSVTGEVESWVLVPKVDFTFVNERMQLTESAEVAYTSYAGSNCDEVSTDPCFTVGEDCPEAWDIDGTEGIPPPAEGEYKCWVGLDVSEHLETGRWYAVTFRAFHDGDDGDPTIGVYLSDGEAYTTVHDFEEFADTWTRRSYVFRVPANTVGPWELYLWPIDDEDESRLTYLKQLRVLPVDGQFRNVRLGSATATDCLGGSLPAPARSGGPRGERRLRVGGLPGRLRQRHRRARLPDAERRGTR